MFFNLHRSSYLDVDIKVKFDINRKLQARMNFVIYRGKITELSLVGDLASLLACQFILLSLLVSLYAKQKIEDTPYSCGCLFDLFGSCMNLNFITVFD